jgi:putative transcriptional regulator
VPPEKIRALRERERASQSDFAACLDATRSLVSKWGEARSIRRGASLKLLSLVEKTGLEMVAWGKVPNPG